MARNDDRARLCFFWHPSGDDAVDIPHVHIGPAMSRRNSVVRAGETNKIRLPTGQVDLADALRLAIAERGVEPRRDDWPLILTYHL
jgi:hypothetical protein